MERKHLAEGRWSGRAASGSIGMRGLRPKCTHYRIARGRQRQLAGTQAGIGREQNLFIVHAWPEPKASLLVHSTRLRFHFHFH